MDARDHAVSDALVSRAHALRHLRDALKIKLNGALPANWRLEATGEKVNAIAAGKVKFAKPYFEEATVEVFGRPYRIVRDGSR